MGKLNKWSQISMKMTPILFLSFFVFSCSVLRQNNLLHEKKNNITILTSSIDGRYLKKSDGKYLADKLTEYLINDSLSITDRSLVNAFEVSFDLEGRYALSPQELQRLFLNFPSDYFILSRCREISVDLHAYEIEVRVVDKNYKTIMIKSVQVKGKIISGVLREAAQQIASIL